MKIIIDIPDNLVEGFYKTSPTVGLEQCLINLLAVRLFATDTIKDRTSEDILDEAFKKVDLIKAGNKFTLKELINGFSGMPIGKRRQLGKDFITRLERHNQHKGIRVFEITPKSGRTEILKTL